MLDVLHTMMQGNGRMSSFEAMADSERQNEMKKLPAIPGLKKEIENAKIAQSISFAEFTARAQFRVVPLTLDGIRFKVSWGRNPLFSRPKEGGSSAEDDAPCRCGDS
jgi:hypothetical protein